MIERKKQMLKSKRKVCLFYISFLLIIIKTMTILTSLSFQLVKMLMVVVSLYTLSYFPLHIVWVTINSTN